MERYIQRDVDLVGSNEEYRFFMAFSYEIMDRYGRLLCWLHQNLPRDQREGRISYNEEMLKSGMALLYFIFSNINPFRRKSIVESIPDLGDFKRNIEEDLSLSEVRQYVREARNQYLGIFNPSNPLLLEPFELRYLARIGPPPRHVIDLRSDNPVLLKPSKYYPIPHKDRLSLTPSMFLYSRKRDIP